MQPNGTDHLRILYFILINPYMSYGNVLWGNSHQMHIRKIETLQKKPMRIITKSSYNEHTSPLYRRIFFSLKLADIHDLSMYLFMHDFEDPRIPLIRTELVRRSMNYRGPYLWMNLDDKLKKNIIQIFFLISNEEAHYYGILIR